MPLIRHSTAQWTYNNGAFVINHRPVEGAPRDSWWALQLTRTQWYRTAASEVPRMTKSREGRLPKTPYAQAVNGFEE